MHKEKNMEKRILEIMTELVAMKSTSCSIGEQEPAKWFENFFKSMPYFKEHPELTGAYVIPNDPYGRTIPYALLKGNKVDTVVFSGHFDVVSTEEYGKAEPWAYEVGTKLEEMLAEMPLDDRARADLESGEWFWGRGVADMKGGLAIHATLFEEYAKEALAGTLEGSILFMPVPDEESYSAGMRSGIAVLRKLKEEHNLDYKLLIDPEPTKDVDGALTMSLGSVGKVMPAIIVQGKKGHAGHCYGGFSALSVLSDIYLRTNGSLEFSDVYEDEATVPPTWANMRDMKPGYDVSIPHRAYGYFTVFSFDSTPEDAVNKLKKICTEAFEAQVAKLDAEYQQYKKINKAERMEKIHYEPCVVAFGELCNMLKEKDAEGFEKFYAEAYERTIAKVNSGETNFPSATIAIMEEVLNYSNIQYPITIIGFAPPYYPPVHSDHVKGKEGFGTKAFQFVSELSEREYNQKVIYENYFMGISDLSYGAITAPFDYVKYSDNTPLWGDSYNLDFESIEYVGIPGVIYGPIGREYHTYVERVNKKSLLVDVPSTTKALVEYMWNL